MEDTRPYRRQRRSRRGSVRILPILVLGVVCILTVAGVWGYDRLPKMAENKFGPASIEITGFDRFLYSVRLFMNKEALTNPADPAGNVAPFDIELGESATSVALRLQHEGLIRDANAFRIFLVYSGLDRGIQAGRYEINPRLTAVEIGRALQDSTPQQVTFQILAGWRLEEIAAALPTSGLNVRPEDFLEAARNPAGREPDGWPELSTLEGFLLPGGYKIDRSVTTDELIHIFTSRFDESITADLRAAYEREGLSLAQAVTLASIVQRETMVTEEEPTIASVFINRLNAGMKLDSDASVQYAVGFNDGQNTWWTNPLSNDDLQKNSPYNTYISEGLPPGPICNPSLEALQAVAYPAQTAYFYFRARCDNSGRHVFVETYEQHLQNACP
jgi:UPF0755 protein